MSTPEEMTADTLDPTADSVLYDGMAVSPLLVKYLDTKCRRQPHREWSPTNGWMIGQWNLWFPRYQSPCHHNTFIVWDFFHRAIGPVNRSTRLPARMLKPVVEALLTAVLVSKLIGQDIKEVEVAIPRKWRT